MSDHPPRILADAVLHGHRSQACDCARLPGPAHRVRLPHVRTTPPHPHTPAHPLREGTSTRDPLPHCAEAQAVCAGDRCPGLTVCCSYAGSLGIIHLITAEDRRTLALYSNTEQRDDRLHCRPITTPPPLCSTRRTPAGCRLILLLRLAGAAPPAPRRARAAAPRSAPPRSPGGGDSRVAAASQGPSPLLPSAART